MTPRDRYWLAGLLEGEGCFVLAKSTSYHTRVPHVYLHPRVDLVMTDEDIVRRAAALMGTPTCRRMPGAGPQRIAHAKNTGREYKPLWKTTLYASRAAALMRSILPLMGMRRQKKIREVLAEWERTRAQPWGKRNMGDAK